MAITFDAPSAEWKTATKTSIQPRYSNALELSDYSWVYSVDYAVNPAYFTTATMDSAMAQSTTLETLAEGASDVNCTDLTGFPSSGKVLIAGADGLNAEYCNYTNINFDDPGGGDLIEGLTRGVGEGNKADPSGDTTHPSGEAIYFAAWMVEESTPEQIGGALSTYTRRFAMVPDTWTNYEMRSYTFPGYYDATSFGNFRGPLSQVSKWTVTNYYEHAPGDWRGAITDIGVPAQAFQSVDADGVVLAYVDDNSVPTYTTYAGYVSGSTLITVSDSTMSRYEGGNIWHTQKFQAIAL